jgi:hypothetical protein
MNGGPAAIRNAPAFEKAIEALERQGWALKVPACEVDGAKRRKVWRIVPAAAGVATQGAA